MATVPHIRPITDLKKTSEISAFCHEVKEPVFITKNGYSDLVIMSADTYAREMFMLDVYRKLAEAESELLSGAQGVSHDDLMRQMRTKLNEKA